MTNPDDWTTLINDALGLDYGDIPTDMGQNPSELGTDKPSIYAGSSEISPESPESPTKKQGRGNSETVDTRGGGVVGQLNCDLSADWVLKVKAADFGNECHNCIHFHATVFARVKDRRTFHWRCKLGFQLLESHHGGKRVHTAPPECDQYSDVTMGAGQKSTGFNV